MEKVITSEFSRLLIIMGVGMIGLSALMAKMITKIRGSFRPFQKSTFIYLLVCSLFFGLISITAQLNIFKGHLVVFIFYQAAFLSFGVLHFNSMHRYLQWSGDGKSFWHELVFTVITALLGSMIFWIIYRQFHEDHMEFSMAASIIFFIVPFFIHHTFLKALAIPPKILRQWFYPVHKELREPDEKKIKNLLIISFELKKNASDTYYTNFRAKAPRDMEFGELFYHFINDYNEQHPNEKIQYIHNSGEPHGWIFFKKPRWNSIVTAYKNFENTIYINNIRENDIIICNRCIN